MYGTRLLDYNLLARLAPLHPAVLSLRSFARSSRHLSRDQHTRSNGSRIKSQADIRQQARLHLLQVSKCAQTPRVLQLVSLTFCPLHLPPSPTSFFYQTSKRSAAWKGTASAALNAAGIILCAVSRRISEEDRWGARRKQPRSSSFHHQLHDNPHLHQSRITSFNPSLERPSLCSADLLPQDEVSRLVEYRWADGADFHRPESTGDRLYRYQPQSIFTPRYDNGLLLDPLTSGVCSVDEAKQLFAL